MKWILTVAGIGLTGLAMGFFAKLSGSTAYWAAVITGLTICQGAIFWIGISALSGATWSIGFCQLAARIMLGIIPLSLLMLPGLWMAPAHFRWMSDGIIHWYLTPIGFYGRSIAYLVIWAFIALTWYRWSVQPRPYSNQSGQIKIKRSAPIVIIIMAITQTLSGMDWVASLDPTWVSTMAGVQFFCSSLLGFLAIVTAILGVFRRKYQAGITREHFHALWKLMYGLNLLWCLAIFTQYFVTWYGNIPEESNWYAIRMSHYFPWVEILIWGHFVVPFVIMMSRHAKRWIPLATGMAIWMLIVTAIEWWGMIIPSICATGHPFLPFLMVAMGIGLVVAGSVWIMSASHTTPITASELAIAAKFSNDDGV